MEEIKKYLTERKEKASNKLIALGFASLCKGLMSLERQKQLKANNEAAKKEYDKIVKMLEVLEVQQPVEPKTNDVESFIEAAIHEARKESVRHYLTRDTQENCSYVMKYAALASTEHFLHEALRQYNSKKY